MRQAAAAVLCGALLALLPVPAMAQADYPQEALERYWECMERNDLSAIQDLTWYHNNVERIDASVYGLPKDDFDDRALLTIEERLDARQRKEAAGTPLPTSGPLQYPHHLRQAYDHQYEVTGQRPRCSAILQETGVLPDLPEDLGGWASDLNITSTDSYERGEVDIAVDPGNPARVVASSVPSGYGVDSSSNFIAYSTNYGQTWGRVGVGNNSGTSWECDPVSYYQRSTGNVYHSKIGCTDGWCSQTWAVMRLSSNGGQSWSNCGARPDTATSNDRQWHVVDNTPSSACYGNIYMTWHNNNQEKVARSTNSCTSWTSLTNLTSAGQAITPDINVGPDGHVYVVWGNFGDGTFKIAGSADCGASWTSPAAKTLRSTYGDWSNAIPAQCQRNVATQPLVDVDRAVSSAYYGRVYVAMFDFNQSGCGSGPGCSNYTSACNYDVWLMYSDDDGSTFSTPVNITSGDGNQVDNFMGYMRVDEADGSIYVSYHRSRLSPASLADRQKTHYFVKRSTDGGATWEPAFQASTLEGDERLSGASTFERGDYNRVDVNQGVAWPVWIDRRNTGGEEEILTRKLCSEPAHWSERAPTFTAPPITVECGSGSTVDVSWTAPDIYWGDGGENNASRKYQLWLDGALEQDNIAWTALTLTGYNPGDTASHSYVLKAVNQCGTSKDYAAQSFSTSSCCTANPTVNVTPDGPMTLCTGTGVLMTATLSGGTGPFTYRWLQDGVEIPGATSSTYTANDTGSHSYNCEAKSNTCTSYSSDPSPVSLTWQSAPTFAGLATVTDPAAATCTLDLTWSTATPICAGPVTYSVYRSVSSGFTPGPSNLIASDLTTTAHSDSDNLVNGTAYYYVVRAKDLSNGVEDGNLVEHSAAPSGPSTSSTWSDDAGDTGTAKLTLQSPWTAAATGGHTGAKVYKTGAYGNNLCVAATTPGLLLGSGSQLTFWTKYATELSWDKGEVQISTNGGSSWARLTLSPTYPGNSTNTGDACGLPTGTYFTGTNLTWAQYTANLSSFSGKTAQIRWLLSTDTSQNAEGWYVDDISVTQVEVPGTCVTGSSALQADLAVRVNDSRCYVLPGSSTTYAITVSNGGPDAVTGATVSDLFPAALTGVSWSCVGTGGGTCTGSGAGDITDSVDLPSGATVTYTATGTVSGGATGSLVNTASVNAPAGVNDPQPGNDSSTDSDALELPVFCDDLETGDTSAWTNAVP